MADDSLWGRFRVPELPEIMILSRQMDEELGSKEFASVDVVQEKCLNMPVDDFSRQLLGKVVSRVYSRGKWIFFGLSGEHHLLLNLGMGANILYYAPGQEWADEYQCRFHLTDGSGFTCKFWWFGYIHLLSDEELVEHKPTRDIAISPLDADFTPEHFKGLLRGRTQVKNLITNQRRVGGIGNVYVHDILFRAGLHPKRPVNTISPDQVDDLYAAMRENLQTSLSKGGLAYERDFYGAEGGYTGAEFLVAYREDKPCPVCGTAVEKIKTGSTSSYICPRCQKL